ncbi:MAG TPA: hypothetical protein PKV33_05645, partial [Methanothrix sp.]|nr:hypothetical protein [Methanothrix sp.]
PVVYSYEHVISPMPGLQAAGYFCWTLISVSGLGSQDRDREKYEWKLAGWLYPFRLSNLYCCGGKRHRAGLGLKPTAQAFSTSSFTRL